MAQEARWCPDSGASIKHSTVEFGDYQNLSRKKSDKHNSSAEEPIKEKSTNSDYREIKQTKQATLHLSSQLTRDKKNWSTFKSNLTPHSTEVYRKKRIKNGDHHPDEDAMLLFAFPHLLPQQLLSPVIRWSLVYGINIIPILGRPIFFITLEQETKLHGFLFC